jgi:predicted ribosomally synthesized peptide with SipW-like signal peptide
MSDSALRTPKNRTTSTAVRAVLAGGLVLGVGAAITLAAWQDDEFAHGIFTASDFNLVGQVNDTEGLTDHSTAPGGALAFTLDAAALVPGATVYAPYAVAADQGTTAPARVTVTSDSADGTLTGLSYALIETPDFGCDATTTGTALVPAGTALGTVPGGTTFDVAAATAEAKGAPKYLCFAVTASSDLAQKQTGQAVWKFTAEPK